MFLLRGVEPPALSISPVRDTCYLFGACLFKDVDELTIPPCNLVNGGLARGFLLSPSEKGFPEVGAPDSEADEARYGSRNCQPLAHLFVVLPPAQNDATDFVPAPVAGSCHDALAILPAIETFDLPDVG